MARRTLTPEELAARGLTPAAAPRRELTAEEMTSRGIQPPAPPKVGAAETFILRGAGAIPAGGLEADLLGAGILQTAKNSLSWDSLRRSAANLPGYLGELTPPAGPGAVLTPEAKRELVRLGLASPEELEDPGSSIKGPVDTYRDLRDTRRLRTAAGSEQNPTAGMLGAGVGTVASAGLPGPRIPMGAPAATRAGQILQGAARGAAAGGITGAVSGAADGPADLTRGDVGGFIEDIATQGTGGAILGGILGGATEAASPLLQRISRRAANDQGRQVIQGGSDIAAATRQPLSDDAVEEVLASGAIRPFSTTQATQGRIDDLVNQQGDEYRRIISELEAAGVEGPRAAQVASQLSARRQMVEPRTLNDALPAEYSRAAERVMEKSPGPGRRLGLTQAEDLKRSAQDMARYGKIEETPLNEVRRDIASILRQANEDVISDAGAQAGRGSVVGDLADLFVPAKQRLGRLLEADSFAVRGASKASQRQPISLKDYLLGASTGDPGAAFGTALASSVARNRVPSALAAGGYGLYEALRQGTAGPGLAQALTLALNPDVSGSTSHLIEALRNATPKRRRDER